MRPPAEVYTLVVGTLGTAGEEATLRSGGNIGTGYRELVKVSADGEVEFQLYRAETRVGRWSHMASDRPRKIIVPGSCRLTVRRPAATAALPDVHVTVTEARDHAPS